MASYFVDATAGDDAKDGLTEANAWKTMSKVNAASFSAGDTISLQRGEVWRESLTVPSAGTSGNPITFDAYGTGADPIIDGSDVVTGWTLDSGSIYTATFNNGITTFLILENGVPLKRRATQGAVVAAGEFFADDGANTMYVWATDSADPDTHTMEVGARFHTMQASGKSFLAFANIHFRGAGGEFGSAARLDTQTSDVTFTDCEMSATHYAGVWLLFDAGNSGPDNITYTDCTIHDCVVFGAHIQGETTSNRLDAITFTGCRIHDCGDPDTAQHGISLRRVTNASILNCEIDNNVGSQAWGGGLYLDHAPSATIQNNRVHDNDPQGIQADVNSNGFDISGNTVYDNINNGIMVEDHLTAAGTSQLNSNIVYGNVRGLYFGPGGVDFKVTGVTVQRNIIYGNTSSVWAIDGTGGTLSDYFDNDVDLNTYTGDGAAAPVFHTEEPDADYDLAGWRTVTGWDTFATFEDKLVLLLGVP